MMARYGHLEVF